MPVHSILKLDSAVSASDKSHLRYYIIVCLTHSLAVARIDRLGGLGRFRILASSLLVPVPPLGFYDFYLHPKFITSVPTDCGTVHLW